MATVTNPLRLGRKAKPTRKHRPAIWECMLGTVYAMNDAGVVRYCDYRYDEALQWAGIHGPSTVDPDIVVDRSADLDLRVARKTERVSYTNGHDSSLEPKVGQSILWRLR